MKTRYIAWFLVLLLLLVSFLCACAPKELQGSFEGKYDIRNGTLSSSVHRIAFYGDGRGTITIDSKEYSEDFTYSVSDGVISVSFEGQDDIQIQYLYDSEEEKLTLYTKDGKESCAISPVKE